MKKIAASIFVFISFLFFAQLAFAHVIVTPATVGISKSETFDVSVPSEKDNPTVSLKLMIPDGLQDVTPTITPGWTINTQQTEIDWTGGSIPSGQRADFTFRAQVPAKPTKLAWKAVQTYSDGTIVSWTQDPVPGKEEDDSLTPYSVTEVVNDLAPVTSNKDNDTKQDNSAFVLSVVAILISAVALGLNIRRQA